MNIEFEIIPLWIQNIFMISIVSVNLFFIFYSLQRHKKKIFILTIAWLFIIIAFFNSPFWKFSKISISNNKLKLHYGILSFFKNKEINMPVNCKINSYISRFPYKRTIFISINGYKSMKLNLRDRAKLDSICKYLNHFKSIGQ